MSTITKEYVNEQVVVCQDKLEKIVEAMENGEDIDEMLVNLDTAFSVFYDRWVLFFTNHECPVHPKQDSEGPSEFYVP